MEKMLMWTLVLGLLIPAAGVAHETLRAPAS